MIDSSIISEYKLTTEAIQFTLKHLLRIACYPYDPLFELLDITDNEIKIKLFERKIHFRFDANIAAQFLKEEKPKLTKIPTCDDKHHIPVLIGADAHFAEVKNDELYVHAELISLSFILLSRLEEYVVKSRDEFDRFQYIDSLSSYYDFVDFPLVDEYAVLLSNQLKEFYPDKKFTIRKCSIIPTHDIDEIRRFDGLLKTINTLFGDLIFYKSFRKFVISLKELGSSLYKPEKDPYALAVIELADFSASLGLTSEFYFMCSDKTAFDRGYKINSRLGNYLVQKVLQKKMIVGLHGSFYSYKDGHKMCGEKQLLEGVMQKEAAYSRQHYLRFDIGHTLQIQDRLGFKHDTTLGFAEREGYRCGTSHSFHFFDVDKNCELSIIETPLVVMEGSLLDYRSMNDNEAYEKLMFLYERCEAVGGNFVLLWHNRSVAREDVSYRNVYQKFCRQIMQNANREQQA